jgi:ABC-type molybdate transport system substrate-binding protein
MSRPDLAGVKRVHNARVTSGEGPIWLEAAGQLRGAYGVDEVGLLPASLNAHLQFSIAVGKNAQHPQEAVAFENYVLQRQFAPVWTRWGIAR